MAIDEKNQKKPNVTYMSGQEVHFLLDKGYQVLGFATGSCEFSMGVLTTLMTRIKGSTPGEVKGFTEAMYQARALAFSRLQFMADELGADGTLVNYMNVKYRHGHHLIQFSVRGTAVRFVGNDAKKLPSQSPIIVAV